MISFTPFPVLETERLVLRRIEMMDAEVIFHMRRDPRMHEYTDTKPDNSLEETKAYIHKMDLGIEENKWIIWAMEHKATGKVIGSISIWNIAAEQKTAELGYGIAPESQGNGFMKEALNKVVDFGFCTMGLTKLEAYTEVSNVRSVRLLEKCDFNEARRVDEIGMHSKRVYHMVVYNLII